MGKKIIWLRKECTKRSNTKDLKAKVQKNL